ncbi:hypothetical protein [Paenibacillus sp. NPDC058071]|uniref:hypothetical protein n=1 Tax=Paenibacillus sp. NPDC058071 TaxID=3346326 RepID=UPI0036D997D3
MTMEAEEQFYCVGCDCMTTINQARDLFRTGFYRVVYPLGCCVNCLSEQEKTFIRMGLSL